MGLPADTRGHAGRTRTHAVVIVGTGFSGIGMAIALKQAGLHDFVILEKADRVGGTWRENTYPGCACDIRSDLYSYSFEPKSDWSREFATQPEILGYIEHCADKFGIRPHIRFGAEVTGAEYDDQDAAWQVSTAGGAVVRGRALIAGLGPLHRPSIPELPGLERFAGRAFHSAQWDHGYDLAGQRVAVIGTGASAVQFVPRIAERTGHLTVFQRTAPWIIPRPDRAFSEAEKRRFQRVPGARFGYRNMIYWLQESFVLGFEHPHLIRAAERLGRWHLGRQVHDPGLRRKLEAQVRYIMGCLRLVARSGARSIEVRPQAQRRFNDWVQEKSGGSVWLKGGCASWYLDSDGVNRALWPASTVTFWLRMRRVRRADFCLQGAAA